MLELTKAWYLFSFSLGCWTCLSLLMSRRGDRTVKRSMLAFIALLLLPSLNAYVTLAMRGEVRWLAALSHQLTWGYGPLMVILIQQILLLSIRPMALVLHAAPFTLAALVSIVDPAWINPVWRIALLFMQVLGYLAYAAFLLSSHRQKILHLARQHKNTSYYWLLYLLGGLAFVILFDLTIVAGIYRGVFPSMLLISIVAGVVALYVNTIALFALHQPEVFFHVIDDDLIVENEETTNAEVKPSKPTMRVVELSPVAAAELDAQLQRLIAQHKPHLDDAISLNKLASLLGVTSHQLSELLNIHKSTSFYDFLNELRFQESLQLFLRHDAELTIADIAYQSGFNNRNSFYKVFKEKTGVTPNQYRKSCAKSA